MNKIIFLNHGNCRIDLFWTFGPVYTLKIKIPEHLLTLPHYFTTVSQQTSGMCINKSSECHFKSSYASLCMGCSVIWVLMMPSSTFI